MTTSLSNLNLNGWRKRQLHGRAGGGFSTLFNSFASFSWELNLTLKSAWQFSWRSIEQEKEKIPPSRSNVVERNVALEKPETIASRRGEGKTFPNEQLSGLALYLCTHLDTFNMLYFVETMHDEGCKIHHDLIRPGKIKSFVFKTRKEAYGGAFGDVREEKKTSTSEH